jgi:hypothetical protein
MIVFVRKYQMRFHSELFNSTIPQRDKSYYYLPHQHSLYLRQQKEGKLNNVFEKHF